MQVLSDTQMRTRQFGGAIALTPAEGHTLWVRLRNGRVIGASDLVLRFAEGEALVNVLGKHEVLRMRNIVSVHHQIG